MVDYILRNAAFFIGWGSATYCAFALHWRGDTLEGLVVASIAAMLTAIYARVEAR